MKKTSMFRAGVLILATITIFAGCGAKDEKEAQEAVKTAMSNTYKIKSGDYVFAVDGKMTASNENAGFKELSGSLGVSGVYDANNVTDPKFTMVVDAKGSADGGEEQSLKAEVRMVNKNFYFMVGNLEFAAAGPYSDMVTPFLSKWWFAEMPPEAIEGFSVYGDDADLTPEQKQLKALAEGTMWFKNVKDEGDDNVDGAEATKYSVELDKEALKKYVIESSKFGDVELSEEDIKETEAALDLLEFSGDLWVSKNENVVIKLQGALSLKADEKTDNVGFALDTAYSSTNLNGAVNVAVPEGAEKFDPLATLGMGGGL